MSPFERAWNLIKIDFGVRQSRDAGSGVHRFELDEDVEEWLDDEHFQRTPVEEILIDAAEQTRKAGFGNTGFDPEYPDRILRLLRFWGNIGSENFHPDDPDIPVARRILQETERRIAEVTQGMGGA